MKQYVDRLSGEPARCQACRSGVSAVAVEVFVNNAGERSMTMKSATLGKRTSGAEVTNISGHGFWLLVADEELFVSFKEFPWFKDASVSEILNVEWPQPHHLYWPSLDVDVAVESIRHPEKFPLISKELRPTKRTN